MSGTVETVASSHSASVRRRRAESALKRAIASSHVETDERASKEAACRHTSRNTSLRRSSAKAPSSTRRSSHRYSATRYRAKSARIADWSPAAIRLMSALSEELSRAAAHSSDVAAASPRMQTVAIGDIPYIPASPTTDRQPNMKLQSHCPSLGCEVAAGSGRVLTPYYFGVPLPCAHATPSVPAVQLLARTLSPGVSDDVTLSCLRYTPVPHGKGLMVLQYDERFKLGQVDGDDARR